MRSKLKSRKLWLCVASVVGMALTSWAQGHAIPWGDITEIVITYIGGQSLVDLFRPDPPVIK